MTMMRPYPGLVLAGGLSRRMGSNKCLEILGDMRLVDHAIMRLSQQATMVLISAGPGPAPDWLQIGGLTTVSDIPDGHAGPLAGILAGLRHIATHVPHAHKLLSVATDTPFFPANLASRMAEATEGTAAIAVATSAGRRHPVFALWPANIADDLELWLADENNRRINSFLARHKVVEVDFSPSGISENTPDPFFNINDHDDLEQGRRLLATIQLPDYDNN